MPKRRSFIIFSLTLITGLAVFLRTYRLDLSPPGLYADETSIGYNAYSILKTGKDEHGISWPFFFQAFGDYKNPVFIYSLAPLTYLNGLRPETIRLGAAIWGSLAIPLLILITKMTTNNFTLSCLAGLILSLMPWHLHYSRLGFEAITLPTLMLLSLWLFLLWLKNKKILTGIALALSLVLMFYSYTTARLWMPLFFFLLLWFFRKKLPPLRKIVIVFDSIIILLLPLLLWLKQFPNSLMARMNQIAIWADKPTIDVLGQRFWSTYLNHFSFNWLFVRGDTTIRHSSGISSEMLFGWSILLIIGLLVILKKFRRQPFWQLSLLMIVLFPLAAALTQTSSIATRTLQAAPFFSLIIALGLFRLKKPVLIGIFTLLTIVEFSYYYYDLIYQYPQRVWQEPHGFAGGLGPTIQNALKISQTENKQLFLSSQIDQAYIQGLFFTQTDPKIWQEKKSAKFIVEEPKKILTKGVWVLINNGNYKIENVN